VPEACRERQVAKKPPPQPPHKDARRVPPSEPQVVDNPEPPLSPNSSSRNGSTEGDQSEDSKRASWQQAKAPDRHVRSLLVQGSFFQKALEPPCTAPITVMVCIKENVWCGCSNGDGYIWDMRTGNLVKEVKFHTSAVRSVVAVEDRVWTSDNGTVSVWNEVGEQIHKTECKTEVTCMLYLGPNPEQKHGMVWIGTKEVKRRKGLPDEEKGLIEIWDAVNQKVKNKIKVEPFRIGDDLEMVSPIPSCFGWHVNHVWVGAGPRVLCYEPWTYVSKGYLEHGATTRALLSIRNEFWSAGDDKFIKVFEIDKGSTPIAIMEGHGGPVADLCTDVENCVWSCGWDKKVFLWDVTTHKFVKWLPQQHSQSISAVLMIQWTDSQSGQIVRRVWSGGKDNQICIWGGGRGQ